MICSFLSDIRNYCEIKNPQIDLTRVQVRNFTQETIISTFCTYPTYQLDLFSFSCLFFFFFLVRVELTHSKGAPICPQYLPRFEPKRLFDTGNSVIQKTTLSHLRAIVTLNMIIIARKLTISARVARRFNDLQDVVTKLSRRSVESMKTRINDR